LVPKEIGLTLGVEWAEKCCAVVPCFDEGTTIGCIVRQVRQVLPATYVVDDGSRDGTSRVAAKAGARVLRHLTNRGKGAALRTGLSAAFGAGFTWAITLDGDAQHKPEDIPRFFLSAERSGASLVLGNRMHHGEAIPWFRRHVNRWMSRQLSRKAGRHLPDTQCGFRLIDLTAWSGLNLTTNRFEIESEVLLAFLGSGYRIDFVPVQVVGRARHSHIHPVADAWRWLRWWRQAGSRQAPYALAPNSMLAWQTRLPLRRSKCFTNAGAELPGNTPDDSLCARSLPGDG